MGNFPFVPPLANGFLTLKSINWSRTMESDVSVTVLILILSLFHQNIITSSATLTTTSFFVQHAVPSGLATFYALCNFQLQVQQRALRARNYCTTCRALRARNYLVPRPSATSRAPRARKPSEFPRQAFLFQVFLQLFVPPGLASLQSPRDKLSLSKFSCNSPVNNLAKIKDEDTSDT